MLYCSTRQKKILSHAQPTIFHSGKTTIIEAFKYTPKRNNYSFTIHEPNHNKPQLPDITLTEVTFNDMGELWKEAWSPRNIMSTSQVVFAIFGVIIAFLLLMCCVSPKFRHFWRAGCPTENPRKYYTKYKGYHLPTFVKMSGSKQKKSMKERFSFDEIQRQIHKKYVKMISKERRDRLYEKEMLTVHERQQRMIEQMLHISPLRTDILNPKEFNLDNQTQTPSAPDNRMERPAVYPSVVFKNTSRIQNRDLPDTPAEYTPRSPMTRVRFADPQHADIIIHENMTYGMNNLN